MPRKYFILFIVMSFCMGGCASSKDVKVRAFKQDKLRVDQKIQDTAPIGNWQNAPKAENPDRKPTRKVYVVEWTKDPELPPEGESSFDMREFDRKPRMDDQQNGGIDLNPYDSDPTPSIPQVRTVPANQGTTKGVATPEFNFPNFDDDNSMNFSDNTMSSGNTATIPSPATSYADYVVKKDDTLQKISKKFYGGFSKWPRIYEANKDVLKSPNFIKPGITLKIPME